MTEVKVLIEGYGTKKEGVLSASSATVFIKTPKLKIIVDPGINRKLLLEALTKENLELKDINYVILTHYHLDHSILAGIFENAKIWYMDRIFSFEGKIEKANEGTFGPDIKILKTEGHSSDCRTFLVKTEKGIIAIAGDVIWWFNSEEQKTDKESLMEHKDNYATDMKALKESRKKILEMADYIIPGHGKMFKVEK